MFDVIKFLYLFKNESAQFIAHTFFSQKFFFFHTKSILTVFFRILCIYGILEHCLFGVVLLVVLSFYIYEENKTFEFELYSVIE